MYHALKLMHFVTSKTCFRFSPLGSSSPLGAGNELSSALAGIPALSALSAAAPNPATPTHPFSPLGATPLSTSATSGPGYCLFVYNLASDCEEKEIWQLFGPLGAVKSVKLVYDENKKCKGELKAATSLFKILFNPSLPKIPVFVARFIPDCILLRFTAVHHKIEAPLHLKF